MKNNKQKPICRMKRGEQQREEQKCKRQWKKRRAKKD